MTKAPKQRPLDDETAAALTLFNTYLVADRQQQAHERALKKAEKAKDDAAAGVRKLNDRKAPAAEAAEAEARYREAVEALQRLRGGDATAPDAGDVKTEDETEDETEDDGAKSGAEDAEDTDDENAAASEQPEDAAPEDTAGQEDRTAHQEAAGSQDDGDTAEDGATDPDDAD